MWRKNHGVNHLAICRHCSGMQRFKGSSGVQEFTDLHRRKYMRLVRRRCFRSALSYDSTGLLRPLYILVIYNGALILG